jgi:hypothetical protein
MLTMAADAETTEVGFGISRRQTNAMMTSVVTTLFIVIPSIVPSWST